MKVEECRLCLGKLSEPKLQFPPTPLANEFLTKLEPQDVFPLEVCVCEKCGHYQLNETVSPERLFRNYLYVAGTSPVNVEHFRKYAADIISSFNFKAGSKVLDIASNDGTLLKHFKDLGMKVLGIDPAKNLAEEANKNGIETIAEFFTNEYADIMLDKYGTFDLITANNVFAHIPDMIGFAKGVKKLLSPTGVFTFEVSYFTDVCDKTLFDTIYHEHSSYHTVKPLVSFFQTHGLEIFDVIKIPNHGGSIRVFVRLPKLITLNEPAWFNLLEDNYVMEQKVLHLKRMILRLEYKLNTKLRDIKTQGKSIAIYGTPAKATTLMYALNIDEKMIDFAVEDAPLKQGTFTPGKHIPVLHPDELYKRNPDYVLVLAWNFAESIIKKHFNYKGKWIIPIPELKEV